MLNEKNRIVKWEPGLVNTQIVPPMLPKLTASCPVCKKTRQVRDQMYQADSLARRGNGNFVRCKDCGCLIPVGIQHFGSQAAVPKANRLLEKRIKSDGMDESRR
jgi:hypothetical protein